MQLLQVPTTKSSTSIGLRELNLSDNICVLLTDLATEIIKFANLRTHIRKIIDSYFK